MTPDNWVEVDCVAVVSVVVGTVDAASIGNDNFGHGVADCIVVGCDDNCGPPELTGDPPPFDEDCHSHVEGSGCGGHSAIACNTFVE